MKYITTFESFVNEAAKVKELTPKMQDALDVMKDKYHAEDYELDEPKQEVFFVDGAGHEIKNSRIKVTDIKESVVNEGYDDYEHYMFFQNIQSIHRMCEKIMAKDFGAIDELLSNGHDWAADHVAIAKSKMSDVTGFIMNEFKQPGTGIVPGQNN